ncbi:MAG: hypothetical protein N3B01_00170 [Verrucomicrobiae bacterium]|nr:hypothetical protein [Verrucomicrobiae bacterium]
MTSVRDLIETAFENVSYPGDANIIRCSCYLCRAAAKYFRGTRWQTHTLKRLCEYQLAISSFTPEAFLYFLPAYMLQSLDAWGSSALIPFLITKQFLPPRMSEDPQRIQAHAKRMALLSPAQRQAVIAYLRAYKESGTALVDRDIEEAIAYLSNSSATC